MTVLPIFVVAVVFLSSTGRLLMVRKKGTSRFMLVGGKPEAGETAQETAVREVYEEVGIVLSPTELTLLGTWQVAAANEIGRQVRGTVFVASRKLTELPEARAEISELRWLDTVPPYPPNLAPLLQERVLPALQAAGVVEEGNEDAR